MSLSGFNEREERDPEQDTGGTRGAIQRAVGRGNETLLREVTSWTYAEVMTSPLRGHVKA